MTRGARALLEPGALLSGALFRDLVSRGGVSTDALAPGTRLGAFRVVRELGRGGMGVVHLAERDDGAFAQQVALKCLVDRDSAASTELFLRERQILAGLRHPNIARLLDGGRADDGLLWFAMEWVEGERIDAHCARAGLGFEDRLRLWLGVAEAVQFAHARLLIHRDIKPGNVLVDADGQPRLLDFGIAALLGEGEGTRAYSPGHASPEQRAGISTIENFRRENVNKTIKGVHDAIVDTKPSVVFSVSPGPDISKNYNSLYADVKKWNQEGWVDVIIPQLYQEIGNQYNDFRQRLAEWTNNSYKAALMIGHGFYKFGDSKMPAAFQSTGELQRQFDLTKLNTKVVGSVMYSAKYLNDNKIGITDKLTSIYISPAVMPFVGRAVAPAPAAATNVRIEGNELKWGSSGNVKSVVYYFSDLKKEGKVLAITSSNSAPAAANGHYAVSTINVDSQESKPSSLVEKK